MKCVVHLMLSAFMVEPMTGQQPAATDDQQAERRRADGDEDERNAGTMARMCIACCALRALCRFTPRTLEPSCYDAPPPDDMTAAGRR
jgi:hypothetical protein